MNLCDLSVIGQVFIGQSSHQSPTAPCTSLLLAVIPQLGKIILTLHIKRPIEGRSKTADRFVKRRQLRRLTNT